MNLKFSLFLIYFTTSFTVRYLLLEQTELKQFWFQIKPEPMFWKKLTSLDIFSVLTPHACPDATPDWKRKFFAKSTAAVNSATRCFISIACTQVEVISFAEHFRFPSFPMFGKVKPFGRFYPIPVEKLFHTLPVYSFTQFILPSTCTDVVWQKIDSKKIFFRPKDFFEKKNFHFDSRRFCFVFLKLPMTHSVLVRRVGVL